MKKRRPEDEFDKMLSSNSAAEDAETRELTDLARELEGAFAVESPSAHRERALFVTGVGARKRGFPWMRVLAPASAAVVLLAFLTVGRDAGPGDTLYAVRQALSRVGLAPSAAEQADRRIADAKSRVEDAETALAADGKKLAKQDARRAMVLLAEARALLEDAGSGELAERRARIRRIESRALRVMYAAVFSATEDALDNQDDDDPGDDDNSGPGSGDSDGDDDNSGSGSDDSGGDDDNSGSGSDDSDGDDDSSGSGSDDSGDDDNSGSGSDDSGGDDSSGSGSDDSGGDDSSGSGSGGDDSSGSGSDDSDDN